MSKFRFDEINIGERFAEGARIGIKNSVFFCGGGPYNAVTLGFSGAGRANFPFFVPDDREVELLTHMETYREVDTKEVYRRNEEVADPGPQKGPSSTAKIQAETALADSMIKETKKDSGWEPSWGMGYL